MSTRISSLSIRTTVPSTTSPCLRLRISDSARRAAPPWWSARAEVRGRARAPRLFVRAAAGASACRRVDGGVGRLRRPSAHVLGARRRRRLLGSAAARIASTSAARSAAASGGLGGGSARRRPARRRRRGGGLRRFRGRFVRRSSGVGWVLGVGGLALPRWPRPGCVLAGVAAVVGLRGGLVRDGAVAWVGRRSGRPQRRLSLGVTLPVLFCQVSGLSSGPLLPRTRGPGNRPGRVPASVVSVCRSASAPGLDCGLVALFQLLPRGPGVNTRVSAATIGDVPELPDLAVLADALHAALAGRRTSVGAPPLVVRARRPSLTRSRPALRGLRRRGKFLLSSSSGTAW